MAEHSARVLQLPTPHHRSPEQDAEDEPGWAELHVHSAFSFLQGACQPDGLVAEALRLGITVLAVTDRDGLYAARRLAEAARLAGIGTVYGAELTLSDPELGNPVVLARTLEGFRLLSAAISAAQLAGAKNAPVYDLSALSAAASSGQWAVLPGCPAPDAERRDIATVAHRLQRLTDLFGTSTVHAELVDHALPEDSVADDVTVVAARRVGVPVVATGAVHYAAPRQARLAQALAALRRRETLDRAAGHLMPAPTAHLRSYAEMQRRLARHPGVLETTLELGRACVIDLDELRPQLPGFPNPDGFTEDSWLRYLAERACTARYGDRDTPDSETRAAWRQLDHELGVIGELGMAGYFLIVHDIVQYAVGRGIWCQGRGSAASSVVCYVLAITAVDALKHGLLFERFLSLEKAGPPDIDLDIEAGRREEVIQYVYTRYGRRHAANVITYQPRLATHDAARVLNYPAAQIREMTRHIHHAPPGPDVDLPPDVRELAAQLHTLPRHLGVHSGGMVLTRQPIGEVMPTEWATAEGRSILQGDKDDVAAAGLIKIDLLGLGMLSALHTACDLIHEHYGVRLDLASIPQDAPDVYRMIARGDTIGVFQVDSVSTLHVLELHWPCPSRRRIADLCQMGTRSLTATGCSAPGSDGSAIVAEHIVDAAQAHTGDESLGVVWAQWAAPGMGCGCCGSANLLDHLLLFERFLSERRTSLPEIDLDVESARQLEVYDRIFERFGREQVAVAGIPEIYRAFALRTQPRVRARQWRRSRGDPGSLLHNGHADASVAASRAYTR
ncbi:PHP domain-containing protein [Streptomyces sp. F001]|uniref:PHP domain-containing protein n=1 Tax=Streptomyces sp. F001 TaxID=1510026 RepID=UPI00101E77E6|nr:PHP domain-containing protein [Streptomyces sp. F001]RZB13735.1 PHP domain-containing protein [Streptomyces sp. F001]